MVRLIQLSSVGCVCRLLALSILVPLLVAPLQAQTVRGRIIDASTEEAVHGASVTLLDSVGDQIAQAQTDSAGQFAFDVGDGEYSFRVLRIGYQPTVTTVFDAVKGKVVRVSLRVAPLGGQLQGERFSLSPIVVEARPIDRHMAVFERHRAVGLGDYLVRDEFEGWHPQQVTDIVRRMPGFSIIPNVNYGRPHPDGGIDQRPYMIDVHSRPHRTRVPTECPPLLFLDGASIGNALTMDVTLIPVDAIGAVETYSRQNQMPPEYSKRGSHCGVIALWTRSGDVSEGTDSFELGVSVGGRVVAENPAGTRVGVHFITPFAGPVEFYIAAHRILSLQTDMNGVGQTGFQVKAAGRVPIMVSGVPLYAGTGVLFVKSTTTQNGRSQFNLEGLQLAHTAFAGVTYGLGPFWPIVELQLLEPLKFSDVGLQLFAGIGFRR